MAMSGERWLLRAMGAALMLACVAGAARADPMALHCRNTTSGTTWDIPVDLAHGTVDEVPARITDRAIAWKDTTLHYYEFDRRTGALDMHVASSTGGFDLTDRCVLK
jgi:hypothetical protein